METWIKISLILSFIIVLICVTFGLIKIRDIIAEEENANKARYCHYCHYAYIHRTHEDYIYCPQCGKPLRKINDIPSKIEDFDFDTWLENQPEGTFVQGGGIDKENSHKNDKKD